MNVDNYMESVSKSNYMKAADVREGDVVKIERISMEEIEDRDTKTPVPTMIMHLTGYKPYILRTKTNITMLRAFFGAETDNWVGRDVELWIEPTDLGPGIRFRLPQGSTDPK